MFLIALLALLLSLYYLLMCVVFGRWLEAAGNLCAALTAVYALASATLWLV